MDLIYGNHLIITLFFGKSYDHGSQIMAYFCLTLMMNFKKCTGIRYHFPQWWMWILILNSRSEQNCFLLGDMLVANALQQQAYDTFTWIIFLPDKTCWVSVVVCFLTPLQSELEWRQPLTFSCRFLLNFRMEFAIWSIWLNSPMIFKKKKGKRILWLSRNFQDLFFLLLSLKLTLNR